LNGDTLTAIAEDRYGDFRYWRELANEGDIFSENFDVGKVINIPSKEEILKLVEDNTTRILQDNGIDYEALDLSGLRTGNVSGQNAQTLIEWLL